MDCFIWQNLLKISYMIILHKINEFQFLKLKLKNIIIENGFHNSIEYQI